MQLAIALLLACAAAAAAVRFDADEEAIGRLASDGRTLVVRTASRLFIASLHYNDEARAWIEPRFSHERAIADASVSTLQLLGATRLIECEARQCM